MEMKEIEGIERVAGFPEGVELVPRGKMPPAPLRLRLRTSTHLRRAVPTALAVARAESKARRLWRESPAEREDAIETMRAIVAGTHREGELEELAERQLVEREVWDALFWQPWRPSRFAGDSLRLLRETMASDRGTILSGAHVGPFFGVSRTLHSAGALVFLVMGDWYYRQPSHDRWGRHSARWRIGIPPVPVLRPRGSYQVVSELLRRGCAVSIYYDLPGRHETWFLGKPVMLVDGTARLACETDSLVLPQRVRRVGAHSELEYYEALDPRDFSGPDELHDALARVHERLMLDDPAAMQDPRATGWEDCATPERWTRPPRTAGRAS